MQLTITTLLYFLLLSLASASPTLPTIGLTSREAVEDIKNIAIIEIYSTIYSGAKNCDRHNFPLGMHPRVELHNWGQAPVPHSMADCRGENYTGKKVAPVRYTYENCNTDMKWTVCAYYTNSKEVRVLRKQQKGEVNEGKIRYQICYQPNGDNLWIYQCTAGACAFAKLAFECDGEWKYQ